MAKIPAAWAKKLGLRKSNRSKFGVRTDTLGKLDRTVDGILFASKREAKRYVHLRTLQQAGEITDLRLQPRFALHCGNGAVVAHYVGDFAYHVKDGSEVIEDAKGFKTAEYKLKKTWLRLEWGIEIREV